ncbi:MAG TPA: alkaline phosphatase family protein, partial [Pyrinomonadaceae bacterium]|nr:alkaline phosphatase family protein [Pyrinomonadaceae bacterium]
MKINPVSRSVSMNLKRWAAVPVAFFLLAVTAFFVASGRETKQQARQSKARRALIISMDGLDARYLTRRDEFGLKIPNLRRLMSEGASARGVVSIFPSVTYPAHATIVTGTRPIRHGIFSNDLLEPPPGTVRGSREWYWYARDIRAETLWDAAR